MKLLYITPIINDSGGVSRVLSIKTNYLIEKWGYEIGILTQNNSNSPLFFPFNKNISLFDMTLKGNKISFLFQYKFQVEKTIKEFQPDVILVCDFGLKAFLLPFIIETKIPIVFEAHGSKYNEQQKINENPFSQLLHNLKYQYRNFCVKRFQVLVALSNESLNEWNSNNAVVIPNPIWIEKEWNYKSDSKKVIAIARHSYEKGLDRLLNIWKLVTQNQPDWKLEIYGNSYDTVSIYDLCKKLELESSVTFFEPVNAIDERLQEASIYAMTSRSEGQPMVLIEAMACGLPIIAYDCPIGPKSLITNNENGFLIEDGNEKQFVAKLLELMENEELRINISKKAYLEKEKYAIEPIMNHWDQLLQSLKK